MKITHVYADGVVEDVPFPLRMYTEWTLIQIDMLEGYCMVEWGPDE